MVVTRLREYDSIKYPKTVYTILSIEYWPSTSLITYPAHNIMIIILFIRELEKLYPM